MPTFTSRLSLRKPAGADNVNVLTDLNNNYDKLDSHVGHFVCTSSTRPTGTDRWQGRTIYETDTRQELFWDGTSWVYMNGDLNGTFTYQITGQTSGTATNGNSTIATFYERSGQWVDFFSEFTHGNSGVNLSVVGAFQFLLPVATTFPQGRIIGSFAIADASTSTDRYAGSIQVEDSTHVVLILTRASAAVVSNSVPLTGGWASGDTIRMGGRYRVV